MKRNKPKEGTMSDLIYSLLFLFGVSAIVIADDRKIRRRLRQIFSLGRSSR